MADYNVSLEVTAKEQVTKTLKNVEKETQKLAKETEKIWWAAEKASGVFSKAFSWVKSSITDTVKAVASWQLIATAITSITQKVWDLAAALNDAVKSADNFWTIASSFDYLAKTVNIDGDAMINELKKVSQWSATTASLMESANKAMALWVAWSVEQMSQLMQIAMVKGQEFGESTTQAFNDMITGLWRNSAMILDNLWIIVDQEEAYQRYADSIWVTVDALTEQEQKQALVNEVIRNSQDDLEQFANVSVSAFDRLDVAQEELKNSIWSALLPIWNELLWEATDSINGITDFLERNMDTIKEVWRLVGTTLWSIRDLVSETVWEIFDITESLFSSVSDWVWSFTWLFWESSGAIKWDITDVVYFFTLWIQTVTGAVKTAVTFVSELLQVPFNVISDVCTWIVWIVKATVDASWSWWDALKNTMINAFIAWANGAIETLNRLIEGANDLLGTDIWTFKTFDMVWEGATVAMDKFEEMKNKIKEDLQKPFKETANVAMDSFNKIQKTYNKRITTEVWGETFSRIEETVRDINAWLDNTSKAAGKATEKAKEEEETLKQLKKEEEERLKLLKDEKKYIYEWMVTWIEDAIKNAKGYAQEIEKINKSLDDLYSKKQGDITDAYLKAEEWAKQLEKEYSNIQNVIKYTDKSFLESLSWDYRGIKVDDLLKYMDYQEQMQSAFAHGSDEEKASLQEMIDKKREYNTLNDVEKILADYEKEKEALELKKAELEDMYAEEIWKAIELAHTKEKYEKEYQDMLDMDYVKQMEQMDGLIQKARELAAARSSAWMNIVVSWARAEWWPVSAWSTYLVWEKWPELFVPKTSGEIVPNEDLNKWSWDINITISGTQVNNQSDIDSLVDTLIRRIKLERNFWIA